MRALTRETTFGVAIPFFEHHMAFDDVLRFATSTESLGFDSLWLSDHLIVGPPPELSRTWYDAPTLLAALAPAVRRLILGTDVLIAAYRHPVVAAKQLATVDVVSGGRLVVGVGAGHSKEEFAAFGVEHARRGAITDQYIQAWKAIWSDGPAEFQGVHASVSLPELRPQTIQRPHPPILVGGNSVAAIRRAALHADGWHPLRLSPAEYGKGASALRDLAEQAG